MVNISNSNNGGWRDLLQERRESSDALWLAFHHWTADNFKLKCKRDSVQIREAVYEDTKIKILIDNDPLARKRIECILNEMCHSWSLRSIRFTGFFVTKIMKSIYRNLWVLDDMELSSSPYYSTLSSIDGSSRLRDNINAISRESPFIYMPTHRSYADFIIFSYICFAMNLPLPAIAAGIDFLQLNLIASLLRACGSFFIRRSFRNDSLYWETFRAYVQTQVLGGERPLEFFIEGTRSRSGKSLYPKTGLFSVVLDLYFQGKLPDLVIIPVSISYDRTLEEELYAKELIPSKLLNSSAAGTKPKETTEHLISGAKTILARDYGSVYIKFGKPLSIRELSYDHNGQDLRQQINSHPERIDEFTKSLSKRIICEQVSNLVLSPFTVFSVVVLSGSLPETSQPKTNCDLRSSYFSLPLIVDHVSNLCSVMSPSNSSHLVMNRQIEEALLESFQVHKNLVQLNRSSSQVFVPRENLPVLQLRHYANQAMQQLIDIAISCYTDEFDVYARIKNLLSREFVYCSSDSDKPLSEQFRSATSSAARLEPQTKVVLVAHLTYYLNAYLSLAIWLKTVVNRKLGLKALVKEAQKEVELSSDLIENGLQLFLSRNVLSRDGHDLVVDGSSLQSMYQEVFSLTFPQHSNVAFFKSKL